MRIYIVSGETQKRTESHPTLVAGLFLKVQNRTIVLEANILEGNLHKFQVHFTSELLDPVEWIHTSPISIVVSQPMFLYNIRKALFEKET